MPTSWTRKRKQIGTAKLSAGKGGSEDRSIQRQRITSGSTGSTSIRWASAKARRSLLAGGHFNPDMKMHGMDNPRGSHNGDLTNITVDAKGKVKTTLTTPRVSLEDGPNSLFHTGGTARK